MESINQDLQASYNVIKLLEGSNINSDRVFQALPGVFAIINQNDEVLRGNKTFGQHLGVDREDILRKHFSSLFTNETWNVFSNYLKQLRDPNIQVEQVEFELGIESADMISGEKAYYWHLSKMDVVSQTEGSLIIVIGEDISQLRESERQLSEIFSSIPLGIFTVNSAGKIEAFHSAYLDHLLEEQTFAGKTLKETLFDPAMSSMTDEEKEGVVSLDFVLGQGATTYDMLEPFFPKQIFYPIPGNRNGGRWLKVIYQPVIYDETVKRLLIILEDRTELVKNREMKKKAKLLEDQSVQRVFQLKQVDKKGLHLYMKELNNLLARLREERQSNTDQKQLFATVHGIKGIARVADFSFLKNIARDLETEFQKPADVANKLAEQKFDELFNEFSDLFALYKAIYPNAVTSAANQDQPPKLSSDNGQLGSLFTQYNSLLNIPNSLNKTFQIDQLFWGLLSYHYTFANTLEEGVLTQAKATAAALGKKVKVHFDWGNVLIKTSVLSALNECLIHLINNAIDHGIESPEKRKELNKESCGNIYVLISEKDSILSCDVTDDGSGIDSNIIRETAVQKGLRTAVELAEMDDNDILQLIFNPGFSTATKVSDTSGRGIGLEAVMGNLEKFRGAIHIDSKPDRGTSFQLSFRLIGRDDLQLVKRCYPLSYFKKVIIDYFGTIAKTNQFEIDMTFGEGFEKGVYYGDLVKTIICFVTYIGKYAGNGKLKIQWSLIKDYYIQCSAEIISPTTAGKVPVQFTAPLQLCKYFILKDNGTLNESETGFKIEVPCFFHAKGSPKLVIGYTQRVDGNLAKSTFKKIKEVAAELDVAVEFSGNKDEINMLIYPSFTKNRAKVPLPYPGFTVSSSKKLIQQDMLSGIEQLVTLQKRKKEAS